MIAPEQYYPQPARDDLAFKMFAAWINCEPDKVPAQFKAWTCPQSRQAWERVAAAARADLVPTAPKVKALVWVELARGLFGATTPFGCYHVWEGHYQAPCDKMGQPALDPRSEAQADYEARILAALEGGDA